MKNVLENLKNFVIILYILLIIFVTICLLSYNDYKMTVFGKNTLIPIIDEDLEPDYTVGDLVIVEKKGLARVAEGDVIFFYKTTSGVTTINYATVTKAERVTDTEFTYTVDGDYKFSSSYFIGEAEDATVIPYVGKFLSILQSKWGFLFLGVFPSLVAFLYTLHNVVVEVQEVKEAEEKAKKKKKKKKKKVSEESKQTMVGENVEKTIPNHNVLVEKDILEEDTSEPVNITIEEEKEIVIQSEDENEIEKNETVENEEVNNNKINDEEEKEQEIKTEAEKNKNNIEEETEKNKTQKKDALDNNAKEELTTEQRKKAMIEAKMKSMTEEEKRALIEAKLKSMTPEEKKALIEAKKKKIEAEKNKKGE